MKGTELAINKHKHIPTTFIKKVVAWVRKNRIVTKAATGDAAAVSAQEMHNVKWTPWDKIKGI